MKKQHIKLTVSERKKLEKKLSKETLSAKVRKRILGLLALDEGLSYQASQKKLKTSHITLSVWAKKYKESGLDFLKDKARSGRLADKAVELEYVENISHNTVGKILKKTN